MNRNVKAMLVFVISVIVMLSASCAPTPPGTTAPSVIITNPVKLPDPHIEGYSYPETEAVILQHVNDNDQAWINIHAWGLWTALTTEVLRGVHVYETWQSPHDGEILSPGPLSDTGTAQGVHHVHSPNQFHGQQFGQTTGGLPSTSNQVLVTVNWSPEMVADVTANNYLSSAALNKLLAEGKTSIKLNDRSISLKPTYLWMGAP